MIYPVKHDRDAWRPVGKELMAIALSRIDQYRAACSNPNAEKMSLRKFASSVVFRDMPPIKIVNGLIYATDCDPVEFEVAGTRYTVFDSPLAWSLFYRGVVRANNWNERLIE